MDRNTILNISCWIQQYNTCSASDEVIIFMSNNYFRNIQNVNKNIVLCLCSVNCKVNIKAQPIRSQLLFYTHNLIQSVIKIKYICRNSGFECTKMRTGVYTINRSAVTFIHTVNGLLIRFVQKIPNQIECSIEFRFISLYLLYAFCEDHDHE